MNMLARGVAATVAVVSLGACTVSGNMYPLNPNAQALGAPRFEFVRQGTDNGPVKVTMPDGEVLQGRYQVARDATLGLGFGNFSAFGTRGAVSGFSNATVVGVGGGTAFASAIGPKTTINCQLTVDLGGHGGGMCATPQGAQYQVMF
jgi:hypothetical protein